MIQVLALTLLLAGLFGGLWLMFRENPPPSDRNTNSPDSEVLGRGLESPEGGPTA